MVQVLSKSFRLAAEVSVRIKLTSDTNDFFAVASNHYRAYGTHMNLCGVRLWSHKVLRLQ